MSTENVQVCAAHTGHAFGTVLCEGLLVPTPGKVFTPYVVLTWEWKPQPGWPGGTPVAGEVDGYKVRRVNKITSQLVQIVNKPNQKMIAFPKPWPTGSSDCYTVTAFINTDLYGVVESVQSNVFCLGGPTALETVVL